MEKLFQSYQQSLHFAVFSRGICWFVQPEYAQARNISTAQLPTDHKKPYPLLSMSSNKQTKQFKVSHALQV